MKSSIMTLSIMKLSIMTLSIDTQHNDTQNNTEWCFRGVRYLTGENLKVVLG
jgi:hypothetical protein